MRVLLIGGTGFIGTRVLRDLRGAGLDVVCAAHTDTSRARLSADGHPVVTADIVQPETVCAAARDADAVINLGFADPGAEVALAGALTESLAGTGKALVWTSGVGVVGASGPDAVDEQAPLVLDGPFGWRARGEQIVLDSASTGVRSVVLRPPIVHADGDAAILGLLAGAVQGADAVPFPDAGDARWATVHVDDLADLYVRAVRRAAAGTVYIAASPHYVLIKDLARLVSDRLGLGGRTVSVPLAEMVERVGPMAHLLATPAAFSGARAEHDLAWSPSAPALGAVAAAP